MPPFNVSISTQIRDVSPTDEGWYDCQVNTEPKISNKSYLNVYQGGYRRQTQLPWARVHGSGGIKDSAVRPRKTVNGGGGDSSDVMVATQPGDRMVAASTEGMLSSKPSLDLGCTTIAAHLKICTWQDRSFEPTCACQLVTAPVVQQCIN
jgi:hypothetical protein